MNLRPQQPKRRQPPPMTPAAAVRKLVAAGMSQTTIAAACGVTRQAISLIANGQRPRVNFLLAAKLTEMARAQESVRG